MAVTLEHYDVPGLVKLTVHLTGDTGICTTKTHSDRPIVRWHITVFALPMHQLIKQHHTMFFFLGEEQKHPCVEISDHVQNPQVLKINTKLSTMASKTPQSINRSQVSIDTALWYHHQTKRKSSRNALCCSPNCYFCS